MNVRIHQSRLRFILPVVSGVLVGMLASRLLSPMMFERGGLIAALVVVLLVAGSVLLVRAMRRGGARF